MPLVFLLFASMIWLPICGFEAKLCLQQKKVTVMNISEELDELRAHEAKQVRSEAKKCLRYSSNQLSKAAYEIDQYLNDFSTARLPISRQVIFNEAITHLVSNVLPNLGIAKMASVQAQLAMRD
jgi:hypothetical protein